MAIIQCPECGKNISDKAEDCIYCGFPLKQETNYPNGTLVIYGYTGFFLAHPKLKIYLDGKFIGDVSHKSKSREIPITKPTEVEIKCGIRSTLVRVQPNKRNEIHAEFNGSSGSILAELRCFPLNFESDVSNSDCCQIQQGMIQDKSVKKLWVVLIFVLAGTFVFAVLGRIGNEKHPSKGGEQILSSSYSCPHCGSTNVWAGQNNDVTGLQNFKCNYCRCTWTDYNSGPLTGLRQINRRDCILK